MKQQTGSRGKSRRSAGAYASTPTNSIGSKARRNTEGTAARRRKPKLRTVAPRKARSEPASCKERTVTGKADVEPTAEDIAREQTCIDEALQSQRKPGRNKPPPGQDLLASYMDQLSHIPLFTPEQEIQNARHLETLDLAIWRRILELPRGAQLTEQEAREMETPLQSTLSRIVQSYSRAATRTRSPSIKPTGARTKLINQAATALRAADQDKHHLEGVLRRLRREVWGRRIMGEHRAYRVTHAHLTQIERDHGIATRARNNFVRANLRLVVSVARNFHHYRLPFIDLIQEGNVGLMKAVHRFDHRRGFRFSTYAHWWIRQSIERAIINKGSQVRLPVHVIDSRRQVARATSKLTQKLGRSPSTAELAKSTKLPKAKVEQIQAGIQQDPISLDEHVANDDSRKYIDLVRNEDETALDEQLIRENTYDKVRELLQLLNPMEKDIIRRRFGLGDDTDQTLDEIGKIYNLSRERVRQIQAQGLMKIRRMCERRQISMPTPHV